MILKIFIIAVKENMIDIFYFGPLILKTVELCLKKRLVHVIEIVIYLIWPK